jgi:hypothetical protein
MKCCDDTSLGVDPPVIHLGANLTWCSLAQFWHISVDCDTFESVTFLTDERPDRQTEARNGLNIVVLQNTSICAALATSYARGSVQVFSAEALK